MCWMHVFVFEGYAQKHTLRVREKTECHKVLCEQHLRGTKPYQVSNFRNLVPDKGWAGEALDKNLSSEQLHPSAITKPT